MSDAGLDIIIKARNDAEKALKDLHGQLGDVEKKGHDASGGMDKLAGVLKGALVAAIGLVSFRLITDGLKDMIGMAMEAEDIQADLLATLTSTKGVSGMTVESINDISDALSRVTKFEDDNITSASAMLLTFTNIGKNVFPKTTEATLNMAQKFKMDASQAAIILGKALNDPIAGVGALRRIGVQLTEQQETQIKTMLDAETGLWAYADASERAALMDKAQMIILGELDTELGGLARAAGQTASGQLTILQNRIGNIQEEIGGKFLPVLVKLAKGLSDALDSPTVRSGIDSLLNGLDNMVILLPVLWTQLQGLAATVMPMVGTAVDFLVQNWETLKGALVAAGAILAGAAVVGVLTSVGALLAGLLSPIGLIVIAAALLGAAWATDFGGIRTILTEFWETTARPIFEQLQLWLGENVPVAMKMLTDFWTTTLEPTLNALASFVKNDVIPALQNLWSFIGTYVMPIFVSLASVISSGLGYWFKQIGILWETTLKPALESLGTFLNDTVIPAFSALAGTIGNLLAPIGRMMDAFGGVKGMLEGIKNFLDSIATAIQNMPSWTPPWASGLSLSMAGGGASSGTSYSTSTSYASSAAYNINVNDGMSGALLLDNMRREQGRRITRYM